MYIFSMYMYTHSCLRVTTCINLNVHLQYVHVHSQLFEGLRLIHVVTLKQLWVYMYILKMYIEVNTCCKPQTAVSVHVHTPWCTSSVCTCTLTAVWGLQHVLTLMFIFNMYMYTHSCLRVTTCINLNVHLQYVHVHSQLFEGYKLIHVVTLKQLWVYMYILKMYIEVNTCYNPQTAVSVHVHTENVHWG
jgi:hypothetical protein